MHNYVDMIWPKQGQGVWIEHRHFALPFSMHIETSLYKQNKYIKVSDSIKILICIKTLFILKKGRIKIDSSDRKYGGDSINCHKII